MVQTIIAIVLSFLFLSGIGTAQVDMYQDEEATADTTAYFRLGPYLGFKAGLNGGNVLQGRRNGVAFVALPDFGVSVFYPLSRTAPLGLGLDIGYSSYAFRQKGWDVNFLCTEFFSYASFCPSLYFAGFMLGMNFGFPVAANFGAKIDAGKLNFLTEIRLTYKYELKSDDVGSLGIFVQGGYMFNGVYKDFEKDDPLKPYIPPVPPNEITNFYNPRVVSAAIGLCYQFNLFQIVH